MADLLSQLCWFENTYIKGVCMCVCVCVCVYVQVSAPDCRPLWEQERAQVEDTLHRQRREMLMDKQWLEQEERQLVRDHNKRAHTHTHTHTHTASGINAVYALDCEVKVAQKVVCSLRRVTTLWSASVSAGSRCATGFTQEGTRPFSFRDDCFYFLLCKSQRYIKAAESTFCH